MKYIHIVENFSLSAGGVQSVVVDVGCEMARRGLDVYILALSIPRDFSVSKVTKWAADNKIHYELYDGTYGSKIIGIRKRLKKLVEEDKCCLYLHLKRGMLVGIAASVGLQNIRRVEVFHSNYHHYNFQARISRPFMSHYLPVSKESAHQLSSLYGINNHKITLAYNGIDVDKIRSMVHLLERNNDIFRFLSVGRLSPQKNLETSIVAFKKLKNNISNLSAEYLIAGDGPQRSEFETLAKGAVSFLGTITREQVYANIASADAVVFPSLWEGHSIALLEMLAIGCPLVITDIPAFREVFCCEPLSDNELFRAEPFGVLFHKGNVDSCFAAMECMLTRKNEISSIRSYVQSLSENFTLEKQADIYIKTAIF